MEKLSVEELEELREKEFDERAERDERIKNTISLIRKLFCVLLVIAVSLMFFYQTERKNTPSSIGSEMILRLAGSEPDSGRVLALR